MKGPGAVLAATALLALPASAAAGGAPFAWVRQFGTPATDIAHAVAVYGGGLYVAGETLGALPNQRSLGSRDAFLRKYDTGGRLLWTRQFGTSGEDNALAVAAGPSGAYVAGWTDSAGAGRPGIGVRDAFLRRYSADGRLLWERRIGGGDDDESLRAVALDATGVYAAGTAGGTVDAWVLKYGFDGTPLWSRLIGTRQFDFGTAIAVTGGGVYVGGSTCGALPGQTAKGELGEPDGFVRKYSTTGEELWTRQFGSAGFDEVGGVVTDSSGVYVTGRTSGVIAGQANRGYGDVFVVKYSGAGQRPWARQFGTRDSDTANAVARVPGGIAVTGTTGGGLPGNVLAGMRDVFVREYSAAGRVVATRQFGTVKSDYGFGIASSAGAQYVAGLTFGALGGRPNAGPPRSDAFVLRLASP